MKKNEIEKKEALKELKNILKGTLKDKNGYRLTIKINKINIRKSHNFPPLYDAGGISSAHDKLICDFFPSSIIVIW